MKRAFGVVVLICGFALVSGACGGGSSSGWDDGAEFGTGSTNTSTASDNFESVYTTSAEDYENTVAVGTDSTATVTTEDTYDAELTEQFTTIAEQNPDANANRMRLTMYQGEVTTILACMFFDADFAAITAASLGSSLLAWAGKSVLKIIPLVKDLKYIKKITTAKKAVDASGQVVQAGSWLGKVKWFSMAAVPAADFGDFCDARAEIRVYGTNKDGTSYEKTDARKITSQKAPEVPLTFDADSGFVGKRIEVNIYDDDFLMDAHIARCVSDVIAQGHIAQGEINIPCYFPYLSSETTYETFSSALGAMTDALSDEEAALEIVDEVTQEATPTVSGNMGMITFSLYSE